MSNLFRGSVRTLSVVASTFAKYLFIEACRVCKSIVDAKSPTLAICSACTKSLQQNPLQSQFSLSGGSALKVTSATEYNATMKQLIYNLKYDGDRIIANDLAFLMQVAIATVLKNSLADAGRGEAQSPILVPVPLSKWRSFQRGFNQSELIADGIASAFNLTVDKKLLKRTKHTKPQHELSKFERSSNLSGAFSITEVFKEPSKESGIYKHDKSRQLILLDDICTSGATLIEAATALHQTGFENVQAVTVSRARLLIGT